MKETDLKPSRTKRIAKNAIALYIRMFVMMLISLYTVRVVLKVLGVEEYGVYTAIGGVVATFSFISSVLANASQRFFSYEIGKGEQSQLNVVFNTTFIAYLAVSVLIILLAETIGYWFVFNKMVIPIEHISAAQWIFQFSLFSFILTILATPFRAMIIARERMGFFAYISIFEAILKLLIVFLLLYIDFERLKTYALLTFASSIIVNAIYFIVSMKDGELKLDLSWNHEMLKSISAYSSWTIIGTLAGIANHQGINILLNLFYGPIANAAYAVSLRVSNTIHHFSINFYTAVRPPLIKSYSQNDFGYMKKLYYLSTKAIFVLLFIFIVPVYQNTERILQLWLDEVGPYMVEFTRLSLIYTLILALSTPISTIAQAANQVKLYHGLVDGITLLSLPISYFLMKQMESPVIPYCVTIIVFLFAHILRLYILERIVKFKMKEYFYKIFVPIICVIITSIILSTIIDAFIPKTLWGIVSSSILSFIVSSCMSFLLLVNKEERSMCVKLLKR